MFNDHQLMQIEIETVYPVNAAGRFVSKKSPRFFIGQTKDGNVTRFRHDMPDELVAELNEVVDAEPVVTDLFAGLKYEETYKQILAKQMPIKGVGHGFGYRYPNVIPRFEHVVRVEKENVHWGAETFPWLLEEYKDCQPIMAAVDDGKFVAVCHSPYISQKAHVAGVDTLDGYRRKGYATAVAAEWGVAVRALGQIPIYSTALDNVASQGVARKAGLVHYNSDHKFR